MAASPAALPTGTVTFLMTDIQGSTALLRALGADYARLLAEHHEIVRRALGEHDGLEISTEGDSFFCVFRSARSAVDAAAATQRALSCHPWPPGHPVRVRMGLHTGEAELASTGYVGLDVHRTARVTAAAHGGQVVLTGATRALVEGAWPPGVGVVFLGSHRLKDLEAPELLYQLVIEGLPTRFPPLRSLEAPAYDLPTTASAFIGRQTETAEIARLLGAHRLVTLTGPGGVGKTRLSVRVAAEVSARYPGGVVFVPLAQVRDAALVPDEVARALALPVGSYAGPLGLRRLADQLAGRRMLLLLDNLEQLPAGAPEIAALLEAVPEVTVLATSRSPLRLQVEQEVPVAPLGTREAVEQFLDRARAARPGFRVRPEDAGRLAEIVEAVGGLPLAVELVAARVRSLSVAQIADRLGDQLALLRGGPRDLPARQQALRDTLRWSYDLLDAAGRALLPVLAVFPGGATLDAMEAVAAEVMAPPDVIDALDSLVSQGLVMRSVDTSDRYRTLHVVREFAAELLAGCGADERVRSRQAHWAAGLVDERAPQLLTDRQAEALNCLRDEHDNLRAGLAWATEHDPGLGARTAAGVWRFWQMRGHLAEGRSVLERLLDRLPPGELPAARAQVLGALGGVAYWQRDEARALAACREAVHLYEELGDRPRLASALYDLSFPLWQTGQVDEAIALAERSRRLYEELGDAQGVARAQWVRGVIAVTSGGLAAGEWLLTESVACLRGCPDTFHLGWALRMLGRTYLLQGRAEAARPVLEESLRLFARAEDVSAIVLHLADFATLAGLEHDPARQVRLVGAMRRLQRDTGTDLVEHPVNRILGLDDALAGLGERAGALLAEGDAMDADAAVGYALER